MRNRIRNILLESSSYESLYDMLNDTSFEDWLDMHLSYNDQSGHDYIQTEYERFSEYGSSGKSLDEMLNDSEFIEYMEGQHEWYLEQLMTNDVQIKKGKIVLYRMMTVPRDWLTTVYKSRSSLGIYWAFSKENLEAYWGVGVDDVIHVVLTGLASPTSVNWKRSLIMNTSNYYEEHEITLMAGEPVKLVNIKSEDVDIPNKKEILSGDYVA